MKFFLISLLCLLVIGASISVTFMKQNSAERSNVILIVSETLRADHLGCYGYPRNTSPNLDYLSRQAMLFTNAYAQAPSTRPNMWNIQTSKYQSKIPCPEEYTMLAEFFKSIHMTTGAILSHQYFNGSNGKKHGINQGFDYFHADSDIDKHGLAKQKALTISNVALQWISKNIEQDPYFLWLLYFDPHDPYEAPEPFRGVFARGNEYNGDRRAENIMYKKTLPPRHKQFLIDSYDEEIRYMDNELGKIIHLLINSHQFRQSYFVFSADHGEELGDNGDLWDHCQLLSQEEIQVPLLFKKANQESESIIQAAAQSIDIYPTLVDYLTNDEERIDSFGLEGKSLRPFCEGKKDYKTAISASFWIDQKCIIKGNYKLWQKDGKTLLYNLDYEDELYDSDLKRTLESDLNQYSHYYAEEKDFYKKTITELKSIGYLK